MPVPSRTRDLVVVGASAGGVEALRAFVAGLPADLPAAVCVVLHLPSGGNSALASILSRSGPLPAFTAENGQPLEKGCVYVAPPGHHLLVPDGVLHLSHGPTENGHRPAVDVLFRSAAVSHGPRTIGVQLSGALDDGAAGMVALAARGGLVIVQDPDDALYRSMPESVLRYTEADHVLPAGKMGEVVREHAGHVVDEDVVDDVSPLTKMEALVASRDGGAVADEVNDFGVPSGLSCPDCSGGLVRLNDTSTRFRCRVGHAWTADALLEAQSTTLEKALWTALRTLEEKATLARRMHDGALGKYHERLVSRYRRTEEEANEAATVLREHLLSGALHDQAVSETG
ncbi:chemotaxis protein CheB [Umezawaea beigongshangensis]|uniref:chemotaxis protein CheB n=1 Tax=Umezawaea beigongshangensis TaxID=2780383 RepID=UPI001E467C3C|nr:chemotaxis protein CheB [Umezawaea beigongshangensis]